MLVKSVHHALDLRHHKHTGKLIHRRHTSYRVLFFLMLLPIAMLVLVNHLEASASDLLVTATVPAVMPKDAPTITQPQTNTKTTADQTTVSGQCPVANQPIIIEVYDNKKLVGSDACNDSGSYAITVPLQFGKNIFVATVITVTNQVGQSSAPVTVIRVPVGNYVGSVVNTVGVPLQVVAQAPFIVVEPDGSTSWQGSFIGGAMPYGIQVSWGDNNSTSYKVTNHSQQSFTHIYNAVHQYEISIKVTDAHGNATTFHTVAITLVVNQQRGALDIGTFEPTNSALAFVQEHILQVYIVSLSGLLFLWYIEHGWLVPHAVHSLHIFGIVDKPKRRRKRK